MTVDNNSACDRLNRNVCSFTQYSSLSYSLLPSYDLLDNRIGMTLNTPNNQINQSCCYDALKRLTWLNCDTLGKTIAASNIYNANGKLASVSATEGGTSRSLRTFGYDSEQRLNSVIGSYNGAEKLALTYAYNNAQQIVTLGETFESDAHSYTYQFDERDQLTNETVSGAMTVYSYDKAQNRMSKKIDAALADGYGYTFANKLTNIYIGAQSANNRYWYDLAGNLTTGIVNAITNCYSYNAQNKLAYISMYDANARHIEYTFTCDSMNRRVKITNKISTPNIPGTPASRYILHDGNVPVAEALSYYNYLICRTFVRGVGIAEGTGDMIAEINGRLSSSAKAVFYTSNHRGDTLAAYRDTSTLVAKNRYDAFGNQRTGFCVVYESQYAPRYTFSTKEYLSDAQLYLYAYRVYDPVAGRWTQRDPIDYQDSPNLYQFCGNNPICKTDSDGRWVWVLAGAAIGAAVNSGFQIAANVNSGKDWSSGLGRAALSGAVGGALTALAGPAGGAIALSLGFSSAGVAAVAASAAVSAIASAGQQTVENAIDGKPLTEGTGKAALGGAAGGAVVGAIGKAIPVKGMNTFSQAKNFAPRTASAFANQTVNTIKYETQQIAANISESAVERSKTKHEK